MIWDIVLLSRPVHQYLGMKEPKTKGETVSYYEEAVKKAVTACCYSLCTSAAHPYKSPGDADGCMQATLSLSSLLLLLSLSTNLSWFDIASLNAPQWIEAIANVGRPSSPCKSPTTAAGDPHIFIKIVLISFWPLKCIELKNLDQKTKNSSM